MSERGTEHGRAAFAGGAWAEACRVFAAADAEAPLRPQDLMQWGTALYLTGREMESADVWARAHHDFLARDEVEPAARCAFWLAFGLLNQGEKARSFAWAQRASRLLEETGRDCVECGYLQIPLALERLFGGDLAGAQTAFDAAGDMGRRFADADLVALATHSRGRILIRRGETQAGVRLLDEAMVSIEAGDVSPLVVGTVYCSVIEGCLEIFDLRRAQEWTAALTHWCESQPELVPYRGQCLVRRAEILQLHGVWTAAVEEARRACERFRQGRDQPAAGAAFYQRGELHRLRGEFAEAEDAFREASRLGRNPQPGLALLRLAQGNPAAAGAAIRRSLDEARNRVLRSRLLTAYVDIMLETKDVAAARTGAGELMEIARSFDAPFLHAAAAQAEGAVLLAAGHAREALPILRQSWNGWQDLEVPYESARVRVLIGRACAALGDADAAEMEFDAARWVLQHLGASTELARLDVLSTSSRGAAAGLSRRELQVLRLLAAGKTNRAIAAELFISERTVERHVSNIFLKLDVSSRAGATAYAYEHQLL